jgi:hypothetical protein
VARVAHVIEVIQLDAARQHICTRGWRWRLWPATKPAPPTISRSSRASPDSRTTRSEPSACSPPPARSWTPAAAAGCTPSCPASRTTMRSWPGCASASAPRHSSRPRRGAGPPGAHARWNTHGSKRDPPRPRPSTADCGGPGQRARHRAGSDQGAAGSHAGSLHPGKAREAARHCKAEIAATGDAHADHDQAAGQAAPASTPRPGTPPALAGKHSDEQLLAQNTRICMVVGPLGLSLRPRRSAG